MRSTSLITSIRGNASTTVFVENDLGKAWYVSASGEVVTLGAAGIKDVQLGHHHGAVLYQNGQVATWGKNEDGQCGNGARETVSNFAVTSLSNIVAVACGANFTVALSSDGVLWSAGSNTFGQFGNGTFTLTSPRSKQGSAVFAPTEVPGAVGVIAGSNHVFVTLSDGSVLFAGSNAQHAAGLTRKELSTSGFIAQQFMPCGVSNVEMHTAHNRSLAVSKDGSVLHAGDCRDAPGMTISPEMHFHHNDRWTVAEGLTVSQICVDQNSDVIALDMNGNVLVASRSQRKYGMPKFNNYHLYPLGVTAEQVATTTAASFIKKDDVWYSSSAKFASLALSRGDGTSELQGYERMAHPEDWGLANQMSALGLTWSNSVLALEALAS